MANHDWKDMEPKTRGQWRDILTSLAGLTDRELSGKHGPCPACGGKDRFRFDDRLNEKGDGGYVCGQCGSGSGISLLMKATGQPFSVAVNAVGDFLGAIPVERFERNKVYAVAKRAPSYSKEDPEKAREWLDNATHMPCCELTLRYGIGPDGLLVSKRSGSIICPIHASGRGLVNAAVIMPSFPIEPVLFAAGGLTYGGATVIGADTGKSIIICVDWFDAWHINMATGCRVLCCWETENIHHLKPTISTSKRVFAACNINDEELEAAERSGLQVLIPANSKPTFKENGTFNGIERKTFNPTKILDDIGIQP